MADSHILLTIDGGVATITLNRPDARNAITKEMGQEIRAALDALEERDDVAALIVTGAGDKAFAGGADIAQLRERDRMDALRAINSGVFRRLEEFPVPSIAAVRGFALGGGCELAMACDLRVAGESAKLGQPEVGLGILPGAGGTYRLPRLVGLGVARELLYTGRIVDAREAERIGLVNRVVPDDRVLDEARALASEIAKNGALAVRLTKLAVSAWAGAVPPPFALEAVGQAVLFETEEKRRRMTAFLERKKK